MAQTQQFLVFEKGARPSLFGFGAAQFEEARESFGRAGREGACEEEEVASKECLEMGEGEGEEAC